MNSTERVQKWRKENPEKAKASRLKYQQENRDRVNETNRQWRERNPEKAKEAVYRWRSKNRARPSGITEEERRLRAVIGVNVGVMVGVC